MEAGCKGRVFLLITMIILLNKHIQGLIVGLIVGFIIGSLWVGKGQDEMMRQVFRL